VRPFPPVAGFQQVQNMTSESNSRVFDYIEEAHVTASGKYYGEKVSLSYFLDVCESAIAAVKRLDAIKKALFYGRDGVLSPEANQATLAQFPVFISDSCSPEDNQAATNLLHGILGKITESGELLEALAKVAKGEKLDDANILEEVGDGFWYDALILRAINSNFGEAQLVNIAKLRKRFPNAFAEHEANNRDLFAEREILESRKTD
jgi:NTP pyrophosphatase (non-canonical NTP hydrolase)